MNKADLIEELAVIEGLKENEAHTIVNLIFDGFHRIYAHEKGGRIEIRGFGSFCVREYDAYTREGIPKMERMLT
jgi:integration host factor subunit beta